MGIKKFVIAIFALILFAFLGVIVWAKTGTHEAESVALVALESTNGVNVSQDEWIVFEPSNETGTGLIFYPGGLVEPGAYAPILHKIAENGILVVITPMPLNLAFFNATAANAVMDAYPQISTWVIAGHSLGGVAAATFAENNPTKVAAIALWDSYPADNADLSNNAISVISIFGTTNNSPNDENLDDKKYLLPENTIFIGIEGANHAQFGDYGPQAGDVVASMSMAEQQDRVAEIMLGFIVNQP